MSIRPLPPDLEEIAKTQVNEDPSRRQEDIRAIKEWMLKQPHLIARDEDQWILTFLRGCKFSLERTKEKLDSYYKMRTDLPEFYNNRDPMRPEIQELLKLGLSVPLKKPDPKGRSIFLIRNGRYDPRKHKVDDVMKCNCINMDITLWENDRAVLAGDVIIIDFKGLTIEHVAHLTPSFMKKAMDCYQEGYPIRPQAVHYINTPSAFESLFKLFKSLMKPKLLDRQHMHGSDLTGLFEHVPIEALPNEYGGEAGPVDDLAADWKRKVESYRDWLIEDQKYGTNEKKRTGSPKTSSDLVGMQGSFRSLAID